MNLISVYSGLLSKGYTEFLYQLLSERTPEQSISHKVMPSYDDHVKFVCAKPYKHWYIIEVDDVPVGAIYMTKAREIGIFVKNEHQGNGIGRRAIRKIMELHPGKVFANINPGNIRSRYLFESLGSKLIQVTYELEAQ